VSEPQFPAGLPVAYARNDNARAIIAGFASAMPALSVMWQQVDRALADVPALGAIIDARRHRRARGGRGRPAVVPAR
jgi:hypothetical protein